MENQCQEPLFTLKNLHYIYQSGTKQAFPGLRNIDLTIDNGSTLAIMGKSGSGKSTLVKHLNGLLRPSSGEIWFQGQNLWQSKINRHLRFKVGLVFQNPEQQLFAPTIWDDVAFGPQNMHLSSQQVRKNVEQALHWVNFDKSLWKQSPRKLSAGQKRKVAIAGVLAMKPQVLVLDEPTAGLDPQASRDLIAGLSHYQKEQAATLVIVTHKVWEWQAWLTHIAILDAGMVQYHGSVEEVFAAAHGFAGIELPKVSLLMARLREKGLPFEPGVYELGKARAAILTTYAAYKEQHHV